MATFCITGKTKTFTPMAGTDNAVLCGMSHDKITAKDGLQQAAVSGKGVLATQTNDHVMSFLQNHGVKTAYIGQGLEPNSFLVRNCTMLPIEVVVRRNVPEGSSYIKRHPKTNPGMRFEELVVEFYLKTTDGKFGDIDIGLGDPILYRNASEGGFVYADQTADQSQATRHVLELDPQQAQLWISHLDDMEKRALEIFRLLELGWAFLGGVLDDIKFEFGLIKDKLLLSDVVDCDSWRVMWNGHKLSKQPFRDDPEALAEIASVYEIAAALTMRLMRLDLGEDAGLDPLSE